MLAAFAKFLFCNPTFTTYTKKISRNGALVNTAFKVGIERIFFSRCEADKKINRISSWNLDQYLTIRQVPNKLKRLMVRM